MRLPRLPVSRRRHEVPLALPLVSRRRHDELAELVCAYNRIASEDLGEYKRRARKAEARVVELEQAIRSYCDPTSQEDRGTAKQRLQAVLDGHDREERGEVRPCYVCGGQWGTAQKILVGSHWRHADCDPPKLNAGMNCRQERGYASSTQPPTGKPPSDPGPGAYPDPLREIDRDH